MIKQGKRNKRKLYIFKKRIRGYGKGHPAFIYERVGDEYKYIGLTTSEKIIESFF